MDEAILDLDALVPKPRIIKIGDQQIQVKPPKTADVLRLGTLGQKLEDSADLPEEELNKIIASMEELIKKCIPELASIELNSSQLMKLIELIGAMSLPPDATELKNRGIEVDNPKKAA